MDIMRALDPDPFKKASSSAVTLDDEDADVICVDGDLFQFTSSCSFPSTLHPVRSPLSPLQGMKSQIDRGTAKRKVQGVAGKDLKRKRSLKREISVVIIPTSSPLDSDADDTVTPNNAAAYPSAKDDASFEDDHGEGDDGPHREDKEDEDEDDFLAMPPTFQKLLSNFEFQESSEETSAASSSSLDIPLAAEDRPLPLPPSGQDTPTMKKQPSIRFDEGDATPIAESDTESEGGSDEADAVKSEPEHVYPRGEIPMIPARLKSTLLLLTTCPLCREHWPLLKKNEDGIVVEARRRRRSKPNNEPPKTRVCGPARLEHVRMCTLSKQVPIETATSIIEREQARHDERLGIVPKGPSTRLVKKLSPSVTPKPSSPLVEKVIERMDEKERTVTFDAESDGSEEEEDKDEEEEDKDEDKGKGAKAEPEPELERVYARGEMPDMPLELKATLLLLTSCPFCVEPWTLLKLDDDGDVVEARKERKGKKGKKKQIPPKTKVTGPVRLEHVRMCVLRKQVPVQMATSLIEREQIRYDKRQRIAHIEAQRDQSMWQTIAGEAPPCTQIQNAVVKQMEAGRHEYYIGKTIRESMEAQRRGLLIPKVNRKGIVKKRSSDGSVRLTKNGKVRKASVRLGIHGGVNRETTTLVPPQRTSGAIKRACEKFFGPMMAEQQQQQQPTASTMNEEHYLSRYDLDHASHEMPFERDAALMQRRRGLGLGVCYGTAQAFSASATAGRLSNGRQLATEMIKSAVKAAALY